METDQAQITIRPLGEHDADELARLAGRDTSPVPTGTLVGVLVDGRLVAARSLSTGDVIADPFAPTEHLMALLDRRVAQLRGRRRGRRAVLRSLFARRSRGALPGSPPVSSGSLLTLGDQRQPC
jgi:hypothetical protein